MSTPGGSGAIDEFLELEQELSTGTRSSKTYEQGNIARAAKVPAAEVPDDYPVPIRTRQALHLDVETPDGETVATYLEWPGEDEDSDHVERLLDALGRSHDEFANVYGDRVALDAEDGWHGIDAERTAALRSAKRASGDESLNRSRNLLAAALAAAATGFIAINVVSATLGSSLILTSFVAVPFLFYRDAKRLSDVSNWECDHGQLIAMAVPIFNVGLGFAYLLTRRLRLSGTIPGDDSATITTAFALGSTVFLFGFAANDVMMNVATPLLLYAMVFLPCLVYFDSEYVTEMTDWKPNRGGWCLFAGLTAVVGTGAYLWKRRSELN